MMHSLCAQFFAHKKIVSIFRLNVNINLFLPMQCTTFYKYSIFFSYTFSIFHNINILAYTKYLLLPKSIA